MNIIEKYKKMKLTKKIKCAYCDSYFTRPDDFVSHLELSHSDTIPEDMVPWQYNYYLKTKKTHGNCIICKKKTLWNDNTKKYKRFCENEKCKQAYREIFKNRMISAYGEITLLNDPEQQRKMLERRSISNTYTWSTNHRYKFTYTGTYERKFLEFLDLDMSWDPSDLMSPSPHNYTYIYEGKQHFYFPDFFIPSLDLEIEIKDGGPNPNKHPKIQSVDKEKEKLKDDVMRSNKSTFNYIKLVNCEHILFFEFLHDVKVKFENGDDSKVCMIP